MKKFTKTMLWPFMLLYFALCLIGCKSDGDADYASNEVFDPSKEVQVTGFSPEKGGGGIDFFVYGTNFGTDTSIINVSVNEKNAVVISSDGTTIYCFLPVSCGTGKVKVQIGNESIGIKEAVSEMDFSYQGTLRVGTLAGWVDKNNGSSTQDGDFEHAQFKEPAWMCFSQTKDSIFVAEQTHRIRVIDLINKNVTTLAASGAAVSSCRTLEFSIDYDTLFISNDQGDKKSTAVAYALKKEDFKRAYTLVNGQQCNGADIHPVDGGLFYNSYEHGQVIQYMPGDNPDTQNIIEQGWGKELYRVGDDRWEFYIQFEPNGNFAYMASRNNHYLLKAFYDWENKTLRNATVFVGSRNNGGFSDGVGTGARFKGPNQGTFDSKGNFYMCDVDNHCIRKITPDGLVTTFAGRPEKSGYADGDLRDMAQFFWPVGILYDEEKNVFYVSDCGNHRIRTIQAE